MRILRALLVGLSLVTLRMHAVYAPVPDVEQGKALTIYLSAGAYYDSNIFGSATQPIDSMVYELNPNIAFNASLDARTFASAIYRLSLAHVPDRPGKKELDSHELVARVAHTFSPQTEIDISDTYQIAKNPQSLLPGLATIVNTDQSYRRNQLDARFATSLSKRTGVTLKARSTRYSYEEDALARSLDRREYIFGMAIGQRVLPEAQALLEYRRQIIRYDVGRETKDKESDFVLVGGDYNMSMRFALTARLGLETRRRRSEASDTQPYAELGVKYDYGTSSYLALGYGYSVEETSNIEIYHDMAVDRFFMNVQQGLASKLVATGSFTWEPSRLHGRDGIRPDQDETTTQAGMALIFRLDRRWSLSGTVDYDRVRSDDAGRGLKRTRTGVHAKYVF
jgi:hypothetical protein